MILLSSGKSRRTLCVRVTCLTLGLLPVNAWICARRTTDRELESQRHEEVNAWKNVHDRQPTMILCVSFPMRRERMRKKRKTGICNCLFFLADIMVLELIIAVSVFPYVLLSKL